MDTEEKKINKYKYLGVIHIHTIYSDGTGDIDKITKAAKKAGLDWIVITDHDNMDVEEGFLNGVLVIRGEEISPCSKNHYLAFNIETPVTKIKESGLYIKLVKDQGGFGFIAHPDESDERKNPHNPIKWLYDYSDKEIKPDGIEIWNWFSQWADNYDSSNVFTIINSYINKHQLVNSPYEITLKRWDDMNKNEMNIVPAIGGLDAHAMKISKFLPIEIFPYSTMFKTITNVITLDKPLSDEFSEAKKQVLNAVKCGNNIIINRNVSKNIPEISISNSAETVFCGESIKLDDETYINYDLPKNSNARIIKNGQEYCNLYNHKGNLKINEQGKYRLEIKIKGRGFAYSNPILVN